MALLYIKQIFSKYLSAIVIYTTALVLLTSEWVLFRLEVLTDNPSAISTFIKGASDIAVILLPFFFLKTNRRWLTGVAVLLLSVFFLVNVLYFRVFYQLIPIGSFFLFGNFDSTLTDSIAILLKPADAIYIVAPTIYICLLVYIHLRHRAAEPFSTRVKIYAVVITLLFYLLVQTFVFIRNRQSNEYTKTTTGVIENIYDKYFSLVATENNITYDTGLLHYFCRSIAQEIFRPKKIDSYSEEQQAEISELIEARRRQYICADSAFIKNKDKNLIFIIVESLNAELIGKTIDGVEITPTLNRLIEMDGTIAAMNIVSQVADGRSSDGQLLYNTGLLPLNRGVAAMECGSNEYISLAYLLDKKVSIEFICEASGFWNHATTTAQYGYDTLLSVADSKIDISSGYDSAVFDMTIDVLKETKQPFFAQITTMSSHQPFDNVGDYRNDTLIDNTRLSRIESLYVNSIKYFDLQLSRFLTALDENNLLTNSVIIIAADHDVNFKSFDESSRGDEIKFIPFIAVNTEITWKTDKKFGQCDIFPTILDIMGVSAGAQWRGVGLSIFNPQSSCAVSSSDAQSLDRAYRVSDLLLRGHGTKDVPLLN